jgi:hypothetical protein
MLLKKRVVVVGETSEHVLNTIRVLPQLAWSRQNWSILRPLVTLNDNEYVLRRTEPICVDTTPSLALFHFLVAHMTKQFIFFVIDLSFKKLKIKNFFLTCYRPSPIATPTPFERLSDLESSGVYCAGFLESSGVKSRTDLFDLLIDASAREVTIADHAKEVPILSF